MQYPKCSGGRLAGLWILLLTVFLFGGLASTPALADDTVETTAPRVDAATDDPESESQGMGKSLDIATGCAAGAVAGSVLPGIGNLVGCALGGLGAWYFDWF